MQRSTKEGPPADKAAACWPFQRATDEKGKKAKTADAMTETTQKTEADTETAKKKMHPGEFVMELAECFVPVSPPWSEVVKKDVVDGKPPPVETPRNEKCGVHVL